MRTHGIFTCHILAQKSSLNNYMKIEVILNKPFEYKTHTQNQTQNEFEKIF